MEQLNKSSHLWPYLWQRPKLTSNCMYALNRYKKFIFTLQLLLCLCSHTSRCKVSWRHECLMDCTVLSFRKLVKDQAECVYAAGSISEGCDWSLILSHAVVTAGSVVSVRQALPCLASLLSSANLQLFMCYMGKTTSSIMHIPQLCVMMNNGQYAAS